MDAKVLPVLVRIAIPGTLFALVIASPTADAARIKEVKRFGHSVTGEDLRVWHVGARSNPTRVLVVGCIHGNECAGKAVVTRLRRMKDPRSFELWLSWSVNPDGAAAHTRQNARGVDLNRNFPAGWRAGGRRWSTYYPGPRPASEPETRAVMRLVKDVRPDVTIWFHQAMALVAKQDRHVRTQRRYARRVGLPLRKLDPLPGTASRWQNRRWPGHTSFVVELPAGSMPPRAVRAHARAVHRAGIEWGR